MTGMAILLICASWVGEAGWQSAQNPSPYPVTTATAVVPPAQPVQPVVATEPWANATRELPVSGGVAALPGGVSASMWREIEGALMQPAQRPVGGSPGDSRSFGAAGHLRVANYADQPPQPPADPYAAQQSPVPGYGGPAYGAPAYGPGAPGYAQPPYGSGYAAGGAGQANVVPALPRDVPAERGNVSRWLGHDQAGGYEGVSSNRPRVGLPPGRDAFPEEEAAWARGSGEAPARSGRWANEREVSYEDRVAANPRPERRYLDPPERGDEERRVGESVRPRQEREESSLRDRISERGDERDDDRYAEDRPRRASGRVVPASVEREISEAGTERKPWWPLMLTLLGLFASGGFNVYLGWIAWDLYTRHLDMLEDVRELESRLEKQQVALDAGSMTSGRSTRATAMAG